MVMEIAGRNGATRFTTSMELDATNLAAPTALKRWRPFPVRIFRSGRDTLWCDC